MKASAGIALLLACLVGTLSPTSADGIGKMLRMYPEFSNFTDMLTETGLINKSHGHGALTVLAVTNDQMGELQGKPSDIIERVLSVHVLLDYYNLFKIRNMPAKSVRITNLWQASGVSDDSQGYVNLTKMGANNEVFFRSAVRGAPFSSKLIKEVYTQVTPYRNCLHQVSNIIYTPGIEAGLQPPNLTLPAPVVSPPVQAEAPVVADESAEPETPLAAPTLAPGPAPGQAPADAPAADEDTPADDDAEQEAPVKSSSFLLTPSFFFTAVIAMAAAALLSTMAG